MQTYSEYAPTGFDSKGLALPYQQNWLVLLGQNRDSDILAQSNFQQALEALGGEGDNVEVHRFGHWACGWLEIILIKPDTREAEIAGEIESALANYPVLNEEDLSNREQEEYMDCWTNFGARDFRHELTKLEYDAPRGYDDSECDYDEVIEDALDAASDEALLEFFESLIDSGEYHDHEGAPNISIAMRNVDPDEVVVFLTEQALLAPVIDPEASRIEDARQIELFA